MPVPIAGPDFGAFFNNYRDGYLAAGRKMPVNGPDKERHMMAAEGKAASALDDVPSLSKLLCRV